MGRHWGLGYKKKKNLNGGGGVSENTTRGNTIVCVEIGLKLQGRWPQEQTLIFIFTLFLGEIYGSHRI